MSVPRAALITGAGSGIGRATAAELAARGVSHLVLLDLSDHGLAATAELLADVDVSTHVVDVGDYDAMAAVFAAAVARVGTVDLMVNNAAMMTPSPGFPTASNATVTNVVQTNVMGVLNGVQLAFAHMVEIGGGSIVSTASGAGKVGLPTDPLYAATKAAVINLTRSCAPGFAQHNIRINAVCPGVVDTPMLQADGQPDNLDELLADIPLLQASEIATAMIDLALDPDRTGATPSLHNGR